MSQSIDASKEFYDRHFAGAAENRFYKGLRADPTTHPYYKTISRFAEAYALSNKRCLEVGCGIGILQDVIDDYTGCDISGTVKQWFHKPFYQCSATELPFADNSFDAVWTVATIEHIPEPELAFAEARRVLRPGGVLLLKPSWNCRPWAGQAYHLRPYSDFGLRGKLIKASVPLRNSVLFRAAYTFPRRVWRRAAQRVSRRAVPLRFRRLKPNYEHFWCADCDAAASIDPHDAILWFTSRGDVCESHRSARSQLLVRSDSLIFRINKTSG